MTTKEFIEILQKADPSGNGHLRMSDGIPKYAESKPGYWDGPYQYLDEEGNFVTSIDGYKVDIHCVSIEDYACNLSKFEKWEDIENKFRFKLGGYSDKNQRDDRIKNYIETAREAWEGMKGIEKTSYDRALNEMNNNAKIGWSWFQNKLVDSEKGIHHYYSWKIYNEFGQEQGSNIWNTESVQKSGGWVKLDDGFLDGYYHWVKKGCENMVPNIGVVKNKTKLINKIKKYLKSIFNSEFNF